MNRSRVSGQATMKTTQGNRRNLPNGGMCYTLIKIIKKASNRGHFDDLVDDIHDDKIKGLCHKVKQF